MADSVDAYLRSLEEEYDRPMLIRNLMPKPSGGLTVTVALAAGQGNPVNAGPINFTITFSKPVTGFTNADVSFAGSTVGGTLAAAVTGTGPAYNVAVTGMTGNGLVAVSIPTGAANDAVTGAPTPAASAAFVTFDTTRPSVTINQAVGQADPTGLSPITFTVVFSEAVTGFLASDVVITGTAGGTLVPILTGGGPTYNIQVTGMTTTGTVIANIPANAATDLAGNLSFAATFTDNTVTWVPMVTSTTVVTSDGTPSLIGNAVLFTATITTGGSAPTGTMQFFDGASALGSPQTVSAGAATLSTSALALGTHSITATYSGDGTHTGSTSSAFSQVVNKIPVTVTIARTSGANPSVFGDPLQFTATLSPGGTGDVSFFDNVTTLNFSVPVVGTTAVLSGVTSLAVGTHANIFVTYNGDATHLSNTSSPLSPAQVVNASAGVGLKAPLGMGLFLN